MYVVDEKNWQTSADDRCLMYLIKIPMFDFKGIMLVHQKKGKICGNTITFLKKKLSGKKG